MPSILAMETGALASLARSQVLKNLAMTAMQMRAAMRATRQTKTNKEEEESAKSIVLISRGNSRGE
jgi:hypothetical protein